VLKHPTMRGGFGRRAAGIALCASVSLAPVAQAVIYGGGGGARSDCLLVFSAPLNEPLARPKRVRCTDGDPACDADGTVNGQCVFAVGVCANSTFNPDRCTSPGVNTIDVAYADDNGDPRFDPDFQALQTRIDNQILDNPEDPDRCTTPTNIRVPISGPAPGDVCRRGKKQVKITTLFFQGPRPVRDKDRLRLTCDPPVPCDPGVLFAGTFDRIQRQIFNQSCALSGCHDSQSQSGGMLLESGGAYSNIVDVIASKPAAAALGWRRIDAANADVSTSFLYHKVTGDLPDDTFGERMPLGRRRLDGYLVDVLRLWIEAGAPQTGWVPGTD
jgi:hypothetical protein